MFKEKLHIIRPTLFDPAEMMTELKEIFSSGNVTVSKYVKLFEQECARYLGVKEAVAVSSATSGLMLAVKALGLTGEVIVPSFTFTATVHSLIWNHLTPVFVDCEEGTYNIDAKEIEKKITPKTSAIMPVYIFGNPPWMGELAEIAEKHNLKLIFDSAQAFGSEYQGVKAGGFGDCEVFSLSPTKVLTAIEGGLITTNNIKLAEYLRRLRDYGKRGEDIENVGLSARMSEFHALVGLKNLRSIEKCLKTRRELISLYQELLKNIDGISFQRVLSGSKSSGNYMVIFIDEERFGMSRDTLCEALKSENIETKKYFYPAVHLQEAYRVFRETYEGKLPVTEKASRTGLALPLYGHMEPVTVEKVCSAITRIQNFVNKKKGSGEKMDISRKGWQENLVLLSDAVAITLSYIAAYFIRFDGMPPAKYMDMMVNVLPLAMIIRLAALFYFKLNTSMWQYASVKDLAQIIKAVTVSSVLIVAIAMVANVGQPRSVFIIDWLLLVIALSGIRFVVRLTRPLRTRHKNGNGNGRRKKVLVVGAGDAGEMIAREMVYRYSHNYEVIGLIDDNPGKQRKQIHGVPILGGGADIPAIVKERNIEEIIIAIPSATSDQRRDILDYCIKSGAKYRTVPNMSDLVDGTVKVKELREVRLEDLIGRAEMLPDAQKMAEYIKGKNVLITGAGGSIGSELCRQVARLNPGKLILFEKAENPLFYIDMELGRSFEGLRKIPVVGDICDRARVEEVFSAHKPHIVFHAAAHKHVPLMETNGMEAVKNNVFGTKILAEAAASSGVEKFIMLSTDKAVAPTSLMGVSKKVTEMYIASLKGKSATKFMAVRFGNVLGSEGSVMPAFKKMIERGGPITITHPDITRYFMTIPEAAALVMEAGYMGQGGEIFILEMGKQIKILDLAYDMIKLSGLAPDKDIKIVFTGLRPGEKMYEALVAEDEELLNTSHEKIMMLRSGRESGVDIISCLEVLNQTIEHDDRRAFLEQLKKMVPSYMPTLQIFYKPPRPEERKEPDKKIGILIADDERVVQEVLSKFLDGRGYNTLLASNGREALNIVNTNEVRLAFIDIRMPGFADGLQTLKLIKKTNKNIEVIMMTGYGTEKTRRESSDFGAYAYLEKPFDLSDIRSKVESALHINKI